MQLTKRITIEKIMLIWNKCDLLSQQKTEVSKTQEFSGKMGVELIEKSAKDCLNIETRN
jgi:putative ribosome biogenesis GTPase RsgA